MVLTAAELAIEKTRLERDARIAESFRRRGQSSAADRFNVEQRQTTVAQREADLNPEPNFYTPEQILASDAESAAAKLRAQAQAARQTVAEKRRLGKSNKTINEYERIANRSEELAASIDAGGFNPNDNRFRKQLWQARYPELKGNELARKYLTGDDRREVLQEIRDNKAAQAAGYDNATEQAQAERAKQQQAAIDQRNRFLANGKQIEGAFGRYAVEKLKYNPNVNPADVTRARQELLREGKAQLIDQATGRPFQRQADGTLVSVRTQAEAQRERNLEAQRLATKGEANFQDTKGRTYNISPPTSNEESTSPSRPFDGTLSPGKPRTAELFGFDTGIQKTTSFDYSAEAEQYRNLDYSRSGTASFLALSTGVFEGFSATVQNPKQALSALKYNVLHPIKSAKSLLDQFKVAPEATVGQVLGSLLFFKTISVATPGAVKQAIPRPVVETFEIPQEGGKAASVTSVGVRSGSRSVTAGSRVVTSEGATYTAGRPDLATVLERIPENSDVKIGGPLQTSAIDRSLRETTSPVTPRAQEVIPVAQRIIRRTQATKAPLPESTILSTERLPPEGVQAILGIAKQEGATVFGSLSRRQTSASFPTPRDIDVRLVDASPETVSRVTQQSIKELEARGLQARERPDTPGAIEVRQADGTFEKAVEFKGKNLVPGEDAVPEEILGFRKEGTPVSIGGQQFTSLNEELRGVTQGVVRVRKVDGTLDISPPPKRAKDVGSLVTSAEVLKDSQLVERPGLAKDIQRIRELYGYTDENPSVLIADFTPGRSPSPTGRQPIASPAIINNPSPSVSPSPSQQTSPSPRISPTSPSPGLVSNSPRAIADFSPLPPASPSPSPKSSSPSPKSIPISPTGSPTPSSPSPISPFPSPTPPSPTPPSPSPSRPPLLQKSTPPPPEFPKIEKKTPQRSTQSLFDVEVRREGQFRTFNTQGLRLEEAVKFAESVADSTAARSFKIIERDTKQPISGPTRAQAQRLLTTGRYRESKRDKNVFVERSEFAINTGGEKIEIKPKRGVFGSTPSKNPFGRRRP